MKKIMITFFALTISLPLLTSCSSDSESVSGSNETEKNYSHSAAELELLDEVNAYRVSVGLNALQIIEHISYKSNEHNEYMIDNNVVNHDYFEQRSNNIIHVLGAVKVGENIAFNFSTPNSALNAWINSPGHKANIEGSYTHFGVSITVNPETGKKYYTNIFMKK